MPSPEGLRAELSGQPLSPDNNRTSRSTESILKNAGYVVTFESYFSNTLAAGTFEADFPCSLDDGREFIIRLWGTVPSLEKVQKFPDRINPLSEENSDIPSKKLIPSDIPNDALWTLIDATGKTLQTNAAFWKEFRRRIISTHPLSTINNPY